MARRVLACILSFCLLTACLLPAFGVLAATVVTGTVQDTLRVREGAGTKYAQVGTLQKGDTVTILDTIVDGDGNTWYKITKGSLTGYAGGIYDGETLIKIDPIYEYETDEDFEAHLTAQGFPEDYKVLLRQLHAKYPNWVFAADHLSMTWATALAAETRVGVNTVLGKDAWKSMEYGAYNWDTGTYVNIDGGYVTALPALVAYYMDPRNFLTESYVFQFEDLAYSANQTVEGVKAILPDRFDQYAEDLLKASKETKVSAYFLATRMRQEGSQIDGTFKGYEGYYNFFNYGAYEGNQYGAYYGAVTNGAIYATKQGWNTPYKCLVGSAQKIGNGYINKEQDTLYYQKFDVTDGGNGFYSHQYMTNVQAPSSESTSRFKSATKEDLSSALTFSIPVYKEMPATVAPQPSQNGNNNNFLDSITVSGCTLTPTFNRYTLSYAAQVAGDITAVEITAVANNKAATITGISKETTTAGKGTTTTSKETATTGKDISTTSKESVSTNSNSTKTNAATATGGTTGAAEKTTTGSTAKGTATGTTGETTPATTTTDKVVSVNGTGKVPLAPGDNEILITVTSTSGQARTYTLIITRNAPIENMPQITGKTYTVTETITKVEPETSVSQFVKNLAVKDGQAKVYTGDGKEKTEGIVATGDILRLYSGTTLCASYPVVIYGDVNGDGKITSLDLRIIQKHILGATPLEGYKLTASDANKDGKVASLDLRIIQKHILGITKTLQ